VRQLGPTQFGFSVLLADGTARRFRDRRELRQEQREALVD